MIDIKRFEGITALAAEWEAKNPIIPEEVWVLVVTAGTIEIPSALGLKIGTGFNYNSTPWIIDPAVIDGKVPKPITELVNNKFLARDGAYYEVQAGLTEATEIDTELNSGGYFTVNAQELAYIRSQMFELPTISNFSSLSGYIGQIPMGQSIAGKIGLNWAITQPDNIQYATLAISEGNWNGEGQIDPVGLSSTQIELISADIIKYDISTISITMYLWANDQVVDTKQLNMTYTHNIYYGTSNVKEINHYSDLEGQTASKFSNSRFHTLSFNPGSEQYSIIFIPVGIAQENINIVNQEFQSSSHSYNMNIGNGGTVPSYTRLINSVLYNVYVSYGATSGSTTAIIK